MMIEQMYLFTQDVYVETWGGVPYLVMNWLSWDLQIIGCTVTELELA
jgi:hypothetical protein